MNKRVTLLAAGVAAALVMVGGTAFAVSSSIPDSAGVIHGCYNSSGTLKVINTAVTSRCPTGYSHLNWNYKGPAGTGATVTPLTTGNAHCAYGGAEVQDGNRADPPAYACNGAQGPPGPVTTLTGLACTTNGGAAGTVTTTTDSTNTVALKCTANTTDANCTHSDGEGQTYTDCNDLLGTPGNAATYNPTMAGDAAAAYAAANGNLSTSAMTCRTQVGMPADSGVGVMVPPGVYIWVASGPDVGSVLFFDSASADCTAGAATSRSTWT